MTMRRAMLLLGVAAFATLPAHGVAQQAGYPIELVAPGKGTYTFPPGYETPWDKIQIMVTAKMSPNLFVIHGSEALDPAHPDASGCAGSSPSEPWSTNRFGDIFAVTVIWIFSQGVS